MPSFTPFRKTYSALSSFLPSSDDIHSGNTKEIIVQSSTSSPRTIPRHSFLIRVAIFVLLELGFIALVSVALHRPIFLHVAFTNSEVKGAVTAIAIIWHALAVYVVKDILLNVFSAEWMMAQYDGSQSLAFQEVDIVSRLTTGFIDQAKHCVSERATLPFRLSFLSSLLLILLNGLGPSAIGVDHAPSLYLSTIKVANLTMERQYPFAMAHANTIAQLETALNYTTVGFNSRTPNVLIPWPLPDSTMPENMTIKYQSDVIKYDFSCSWKMPSISDPRARCVIVEDFDQCFVPFYEGPLRDLVVIPLRDMDETLPLTIFLFVGRNGTLPSYLNLEDIPHTLLPCNTSYTIQDPAYDSNGIYHSSCNPLFISTLVCNPQFKVLPATINATGFSLEATISSGDSVVKNIATSAAITLFSTSLLCITSDGLFATIPGLPTITQQLFLPSLPYDSDGYHPWRPLSLDIINQNMNKVFMSSAKPYLNGFKPSNGSFSLPVISMVDTSAVVEVQKMALVGSKPFFVASSVIVGSLAVLLGTIVAMISPEKLEAFELENIVQKLR